MRTDVDMHDIPTTPPSSPPPTIPYTDTTPPHTPTSADPSNQPLSSESLDEPSQQQQTPHEILVAQLEQVMIKYDADTTQEYRLQFIAEWLSNNPQVTDDMVSTFETDFIGDIFLINEPTTSTTPSSSSSDSIQKPKKQRRARKKEHEVLADETKEREEHKRKRMNTSK